MRSNDASAVCLAKFKYRPDVQYMTNNGMI